MKRFTLLFSTFFTIGLLLLCNSGFAQLTGTKTIGPSGNYTTFTAAVSALYSQGVGTGGVTFNVAAGTYNEYVYLSGAISGASSSNPVVFDGSSRTSVTLQYSGSTYATVRFYNADYVTFKNMTIKHTSTYRATAIHFRNYADYNTIYNCHLEVPNSSSSYVKVIMFSNHNYYYYYGSNYHGRYNIIENNTIKGGYFGISIYGSSYSGTYNYDNKIIGNEFTNQYYYAIRLYYGVSRTTIQNNIIHNMTYTNGYGIYSYRCNRTTIDANIIQPGRYGMYLYYENYYYSSGTTYVTNNMISNFYYTSYNTGIYSAYTRNMRIFHNSIKVSGTSNSYSYAALYMRYYNYYAQVKNNIFMATNNNYVFSTYYPYTSFTMDYNDWYTTGGGNKYCVYYSGYRLNTTSYSSFRSYSSYIGTHDQNSWNQDPNFTSISDLHVTDAVPQAPIVLPSSPDLRHDIDGNIRAATGEHFIGADQPPPMVFDSVSSTQDTTLGVIGTNLSKIFRVDFHYQGAANPKPVTTVTFTTDGSTDPSDILSARLFTKNKNPLDVADQVGSTISNPSSTFTFNLTGVTIPGDGLILAFDISPSATVGDTLDCSFISTTVDDTLRYPSSTSHTGFQTIIHHATSDQPDTSGAFVGLNQARLLHVEVRTGVGGTTNNLPVTKMYFSTSNTSDPNDVGTARLYHTNNTTPFNSSDEIGTAVANPNGSFSFDFNINLPTSTIDHYWIAYDVKHDATTGNYIDCSFDSVVINGLTYTIETQNPVGSRELVHPASYNNYCDVTRTNAGNYTIGTKRIKFESIDNSTQTLAAGIPPTNTAVQFYPSPAPTVYKQVTYPIMVKHGELNPQGFRLYVDWNNNGYFDGNETVLSYLNNPEGTVINSSFTIPCSATPGWHRMRITSNYGTSIPPACGITAYGEVEDYLIYVPEEDTPVVSFTSDSVGYVGGTTKFTSVSNMDGNIIYRWDYDNDGIYDDTAKIGTHIFNSTGTANVKLQAILVGCTDTFYSTPYIGSIIIRSPTTPPVVNFISNLNTVTTSIPVQFTDLSGMGPFSWKWGISPDTINGNSTFTFVQADTFQNPTIFFNELGEFNIQLTATNVVGSDSTIKYKYIVVVKDQIMCTDDYTEQPSGYLYDDGGKNANYSNPSSGQERTCGFTIYPKCATSIKLDFLDFDICSYTISTCATLPSDNIKIYDGVDNTGTPLHLQSLNMFGQPNYPDGYKNGGGNVYIGLPPSVTATSGSMYIEFYVNCLAGGTGFEAKWSTQTYTPGDPVANFNMPDTIFTGKTVYFENISTGEYLDYAWDLDGNGWTENTDSMPSRTYDVTGTFNIKLIVYSCGNLSDTMIKPLVVIDPPLRPTVDFTVNFNKLTQRDMVIFTDLSDNSVLSWEWSFTPNTVTYYDGTNSNSPDIHVKFNDNGYYSVKLQAWNSRGDSFELKNNYVWVYSYCNPGVGSLNADVGMSEVILQNSLGDTLIIQSSTIGEAGYTDYSANQIAELAMGGTYIITMKRNSTFNNISRSAWIDYAKDGDFDDPMELLFSQQNSPTISLTDSFTIPFTVPLGLTRLRLGTNLGILGNKGCGPNYSGEFEDYGVVITEDNTKPVIYLYDYDSIMIEYGDTLIFAKCAVFTLPPYIAMDDVNGNITNNVVPGGTVNTSLTGTTMLTFDVSDVAGNAADQAYIYVTILPNTKPPKITLDGNNPDSVAVFGSWSEPGFTDSAFCGIVIWDTTFGTVNTLKPGVYIITYMAMDDDSNTSTAYRDVVVYDLVDPTIVLQGDNPFYIEVNTSFNDPGVTIYDNVNQNISPDITGFVDTSKIGTYFLRYCVTDSSDNGPICVDRTVITYDSTAPVLTVIGPDTICIDVFHNFNDPGYTVYDNYWATNNIKVTITENINTYQLGYYDVTYVAKDGSGNESAPLKRVVCIEDNEAPTIKLNGAGIITVLQWNDFEDPGVTSIDNYYDESNIIISYNENGTWDSSSKHYLGIYTYTYKACDPSDNCSDEITRLLYVEENVGITTNLVVDGNISFYPNPAKNELNIDIELPDHNNVKIGLYNTLGEKVLNVFEGNMQEEHFNVNIDNLSSGVYYIRFIIGDSQYLNKKFIIAK